jgi:ribosomal protein S19
MTSKCDKAFVPVKITERSVQNKWAELEQTLLNQRHSQLEKN